MEDSGCIDDEGRPILDKVDLMETFFADVSKNHILSWWKRGDGARVFNVFRPCTRS